MQHWLKITSNWVCSLMQIQTNLPLSESSEPFLSPIYLCLSLTQMQRQFDNCLSHRRTDAIHTGRMHIWVSGLMQTNVTCVWPISVQVHIFVPIFTLSESQKDVDQFTYKLSLRHMQSQCWFSLKLMALQSLTWKLLKYLDVHDPLTWKYCIAMQVALFGTPINSHRRLRLDWLPIWLTTEMYFCKSAAEVAYYWPMSTRKLGANGATPLCQAWVQSDAESNESYIN